MLPVPTAAVLAAAVLAVAGLLAAALVGCAAPSAAEQLRVQVQDTLPHDTTMSTQGLEISGGVLYESSGLVGQSRVRATALSSAVLLREATLPAPLFGEGLTVAGDRLWQLTYTSGLAIERDPATLTERRRVTYQGEGWGLCNNGDRLVMSNGSERLTFRDPVTFAPSGQVVVRLDGEPVRRLNELECADGVIWANVFQDERILRIDPGTGTVTGVVDGSGLLSPPPQSNADVLNGIAAIPGTDEFLVTGKNWPSLFRVRFVPA
ncbi:MAG: glutaminyl-peptide cyclotransferase [Pseudonocardiaceae bacterium]